MNFTAYLGDDYIDIVPLDEGGVGEVFTAFKKNLGVKVAIKRIKTQLIGKLDDEQEANILKKLKHKFLPHIYDIIRADDGFTYTVTDFVNGMNMQQFVQQNGAVQKVSAYKWACQLCEAVEYLHEQSPPIIHCDIKPGNVMITESGDICLIDFNTSLEYAEHATAIGASAGYAAPEQYNSNSKKHSISKATDVYGIGATLYYLITGYRPQNSTEQVTPLDEYSLQHSSTFISIITKSMEKSADKRFSSASEMFKSFKNIKKLDSRFKKVIYLKRMTFLVIAIAFIAFVSIATLGYIKLNGDSESAYLSIIENANKLSAELKFEECEALLMQAIADTPSRVEAYSALAANLYKQGKFDECISLIESQVMQGDIKPAGSDSNKDFSNIAYLLADCYFEKGDYESAEREYSSAIFYSPDVTFYYRDLAVAQAKNGNIENAKETMQTLAKFAGTQADVLLTQGEIYAVSNMHTEALDCFDKAIVNANNDKTIESRAYLLAAQACRELGADALDKELEYLESAVTKIDINRSTMHQIMLAQAYLRKGYADIAQSGIWYEKAVNAYAAVINNGYETMQVKCDYALALQYTGSYDVAEQVLLEITEQFPENYQGYMILALNYYAKENSKDSSVRDYNKFKQTAEVALLKYKTAQVAGAFDPEMDRLSQLLSQL